MPYRDNLSTYTVFTFRIPYIMDRYDFDMNVIEENVYWDSVLEDLLNKKAAQGYKLVSHSMVAGMQVSNPLDPSDAKYQDKYLGYVISCVFTLG